MLEACDVTRGGGLVLTSAEGKQLYDWLGQFSNSPLDLSDPKGVSDGMSRLADLSGTGEQQPSRDQQREIYDFGQKLFNRLYP